MNSWTDERGDTEFCGLTHSLTQPNQRPSHPKGENLLPRQAAPARIDLQGGCREAMRVLPPSLIRQTGGGLREARTYYHTTSGQLKKKILRGMDKT